MTNDLISREAAKEAVKYIPWCDWSAAGRTLDELEAVDAAPVVQSNWKYFRKQNIAVCLNCSFERDLDANFGAAVACPNCGAKMGAGDDTNA